MKTKGRSFSELLDAIQEARERLDVGYGQRVETLLAVAEEAADEEEAEAAEDGHGEEEREGGERDDREEGDGGRGAEKRPRRRNASLRDVMV